MKKPDSNFSVKIRNRAFSIHSLIYCDFQRKAQPECVESILEVNAAHMMMLYNETSDSPVSVTSSSSESDFEKSISCSHSEISDVNEQDGGEDIFGLLYREEEV
jgi:hypothetical protein